jgi:putative tryptophan/tyrosine transport system substrate-binding protein
MRRRDFITFIASAVATAPSTARAQQDTARAVGVLATFSEDEMRPVLAAFRSRMIELGWIEGRNLSIETKFGSGDHSRLAAEAESLLSRNPDVMLAMGTPGLTAVLEHSRTVPVVFTLVGDPVGQHLVASLAKPGGNATGFTNFEFSIGTKWLELLREISPSLSHVTVIANPANPFAKPLADVIEETGRAIAVPVSTASVHSSDDIQAAISTGAHQSGGGIIVLPDGLAVVHAGLIVELAERNRLPAVYPFRTFCQKGGLLTYGLDVPEIYRQAADYVDRILRGEKPADLPVQAPTKFELVVNLKTAKLMGLTIPQSLLAGADEVIE